MSTKVVMEALSPTMEEGRLVEWKKQVGEPVAVGDVLAEVETDKAVMELVARAGGTLLKQVIPAGTTVPVSELVVGLKCGGSDGFSGVTANPLVGRIADKVADAGGTPVLTEIPEVFGAENVLLQRAAPQIILLDAEAVSIVGGREEGGRIGGVVDVRDLA